MSISARAAYQEVLWNDARLVDLRPEIRRATAGEVHPVLRPTVVGTDQLAERLDPRGRDRLEWTAYDARVVLLGAEGDDVAWAVAALARLGLWRTAYVAGGFAAWHEAGMPVQRRYELPPGTGFHAGDVLDAVG